MLEEQGGCCLACGEPFNGEQPHIDHDHEANRVRGLVHATCNTSIIGSNTRETVGRLVRMLGGRVGWL